MTPDLSYLPETNDSSIGGNEERWADQHRYRTRTRTRSANLFGYNKCAYYMVWASTCPPVLFGNDGNTAQDTIRYDDRLGSDYATEWTSLLISPQD